MPAEVRLWQADFLVLRTELLSCQCKMLRINSRKWRVPRSLNLRASLIRRFLLYMSGSRLGKKEEWGNVCVKDKE